LNNLDGGESDRDREAFGRKSALTCDGFGPRLIAEVDRFGSAKKSNPQNKSLLSGE
jgi:hypothetical protein